MWHRLHITMLVIAALLYASNVAADGVDKVLRKPGSEMSWGKLADELIGFGAYQKSVALVIGISEYSVYGDLKGAKNDPIRVADYLINEAGFDIVYLLTEEKVTLPRIRQLMIVEIPKLLDSNDRFVFYWSGHGDTRVLPKGGEIGHLVLPDTPKEGYDQMIAMSVIQRWDNLIGAEQVLYLIDACFSGYTWAQPKSDGDERRETINELARPARHLFTAGTAGEETIVIDDLGGSVFTRALLDGWRGAADAANAYPRDGIVSISELEFYVKKRVRYERRRVGWSKPITPQARDIGINPGEFFFLTSRYKEEALRDRGGEPSGKFLYGRPVPKSGDTPPIHKTETSKTAPPPPSFDARALELAFWQSIEDSNNPADFEDYLARYPDGLFSGLAKRRLAALTKVAALLPPAAMPGYEEAAVIVEIVVTAELGAGGPEISRGWAIESNGACYVIALKHGVYDTDEGPFDNIVIRGVRANGVTPISRPATLMRVFDADLALLRLAESKCPFGLPSGFIPPDDGRAWILRPFDQGYGREAHEVRSLFEFLTPDEHIGQVSAPETTVQTGWSGSTVFLGNKRVGMVRAVTPDGRSVIFYTQKKIQDEVEDYLQVFMTTTETADGRSRSDRIEETIKECPGCPEMVVVPAGRFTMGSPKSEPERQSDENLHKVSVRSFALSRYEVTFAEYDPCVQDGICSNRPGDERWGRDNRPVIDVSWNDAQSYVKWLSGKTGAEYRLPSEAEWEYAARAETPTPFFFGRTITPTQANYGRHLNKTAPVGSYPANAFGLYDMHGNVWEWVEDCWHDNYSEAPSDGSAWTSGGDCGRRVLRGGAWFNLAGILRSANRARFKSGYRFVNLGFRVARTLDR